MNNRPRFFLRCLSLPEALALAGGPQLGAPSWQDVLAGALAAACTDDAENSFLRHSPWVAAACHAALEGRFFAPPT